MDLDEGLDIGFQLAHRSVSSRWICFRASSANRRSTRLIQKAMSE
ncbi:hypothetical protein BAL199_24359 [alpha proteobacterium BAL199]|nr:hypothetical protein BAL199_24359 [alpha proteobacterium BAL199]